MTRLTEEEIQRRRYLTKKLQEGTITYEEAIELNHILEKEKKIAEEERDTLALIAILLLIGMLAAYFNSKK